jgi:lysophospholipase L1-like esterase
MKQPGEQTCATNRTIFSTAWGTIPFLLRLSPSHGRSRVLQRRDVWKISMIAIPVCLSLISDANDAPVKALRHALLRLCWIFSITIAVLLGSTTPAATAAQANLSEEHWIGTWATAPQPALPGNVDMFQKQTLRVIVHTSAGGKKVRIKISNTYGDQPLQIGGAHIARRTAGAEINSASDRKLLFQGKPSVSVPAHSQIMSDPVGLEAPALSDLAISLFLPQATKATTSHILALQTSYVSTTGDFTQKVELPVEKTIDSWPFLTGVDVVPPPDGATIVALGSSLTDGDGSTTEANHRWPDALAERLQKAGGTNSRLGVLNLGIIGNRLLHDSPQVPASPFGAALGESGLARFERDVLSQPGIKYVFVCLGMNDILFPGFAFTPAAETVSAQDIIAGYRQLIARAHHKHIRIIGTTIPPFENAFFKKPHVEFYTPEREAVREEVNAWILHSGAFDSVVDFDTPVRDPAHPTRIRPDYDSGDHLHVNDAGYIATANAVPLSLFD